MDSTAIDFGFIQIKWYSIFILIAMLTASILVQRETQRKGLDKETLIDMLFYGLLIGMLGARVYYVLFNLNYYIKYPLEIVMIWHGGLAIHGGILATLFFLIFYSKKKNLNLLLILDTIVIGLIIAQAIGRWGNFFNGEAYGREVTKNFLENLHLPKFIIKGMYIDGAYREPTFLYESIASVIGFIILILVRRIKTIKTGTLTSIYLVWYGVVRIIIESFRSDSLMLGSIKMAQLISLISILSGFILWMKTRNNKQYQEDIIKK